MTPGSPARRPGPLAGPKRMIGRAARFTGRRPVRLRLTLIYSGLFLLAGAALLAVTYGLVAQSLNTSLAAAVSSPAGSYEAQAVKVCEATSGGQAAAAACKAKAQ